MDTQVSDRPAAAGAGRKGLYLYAVIDAGEDQELGPLGIDGGQVTTLGQGRVAAVVSEVTRGKLRPERRRLAAHHEVLRRLRERHTVLPMAFGTVTGGADAIRRILLDNEEALLGQLRRVTGKMEMGLRVVWDVPNIFAYIVERRADLGALRDSLFRSGHEPSHEDMIELGRLFDRALGEERAEQTARVLAVLPGRPGASHCCWRGC
jgi:Gas vesicle synthesis protein GvpL/GvpF